MTLRKWATCVSHLFNTFKHRHAVLALPSFNQFTYCDYLIVSALNSNVQVIQGTLGTNVSMFVRSLGFILFSLIVLGLMSAPLTGCVFGGLLPLTIFQQCYAKLI